MSKEEGMTVQETASLHEKAVQAVARGEVPKIPASRARPLHASTRCTPAWSTSG